MTFGTTIVPPVTLPPPVTTRPPTSVVGGPTAYYRLAPDLDLAWTDQDGVPQLCWRTPIDEQCIPEPITTLNATSTDVVPGSEQHALILVSDSHEERTSRPISVTVTFIDGESYRAAINWEHSELDFGIVRVSRPAEEIDAVATD